MKVKPMNETTARLGRAMRAGRWMCRLTHDDAARLLRVLPNDLLEYECGVKQIPTDILVHALTMGYRMMEVRTMRHNYIHHRKLLRELKQTVKETE